MRAGLTEPGRVFYVGPFGFPEGDAAAGRVLGIGKALRSCGWNVIFGSGLQVGRPCDRQLDGSFRYAAFSYSALGERTSVERPVFARMQSFLRRGEAALRWLEDEGAMAGDVVIAYGGVLPLLFRLRRWCRFKCIPLIVDCTEWYDPSQLPGGSYGPVRVSEEIRMRVLNRKVDGMLVISRYLEAFYSGRFPVLRVPPLIDLEEAKWTPPVSVLHEQETVFAYAGNPGNKDLFGNMLRAFWEVAAGGADFRLVIAGPSRASTGTVMRSKGIGTDALGRWIDVRERLAHSMIPEFLAAADFTVLARPPLRYAMAGFPTKVVESLAAGTPPLLNVTSDLGEIIRDGQNGIVARDHSVTALADAIRRAIAIQARERQAMRARARQTAELHFDVRRYIEPLRVFLSHVIQQYGPRGGDAKQVG